MGEILRIIIISMLCVPAGIFLGNSAVYVINHVPASWLCDYGEIPTEEKFPQGRQRLNSHPWKLAFSAMFAGIAIYLCNKDLAYAVPALVEIWLLLLIAIADKKYMIIPDQFVIFLALASVGFFAYFGSWQGMFFGALLGGGFMLIVALLGKVITKRDSLGFGDVKLMAAIGLTTGVHGTAVILVLSSFLSCAVFAYRLLRKRIKLTDVQPLGPYIAIATALFLLI